MKLDNRILNCYINKTSLAPQDEDIYQYTHGKRVVQTNRQEVCESLYKEIIQYETSFPLWNTNVYHATFSQTLQSLDDITIIPIVGAQADFDCEVVMIEQKPNLIIDLLNIADYTTIVSEMKYILHNQIHLKLTRYLLQQSYPQPKNYQEELAYRFFVCGLSQFLAWRDGIHQAFQNQQYESKKQQSLMLFQKATSITDKKLQAQISSPKRLVD